MALSELSREEKLIRAARIAIGICGAFKDADIWVHKEWGWDANFSHVLIVYAEIESWDNCPPDKKQQLLRKLKDRLRPWGVVDVHIYPIPTQKKRRRKKNNDHTANSRC